MLYNVMYMLALSSSLQAKN